MATTFALHPDNRPNKLGKYVVYIRVTQDRKMKHIKTSIALNRRTDWNDKKQTIRSSEPHSAAWNEVLQNELEKVKEKYRELKDSSAASADNIKAEVEASEKTSSFIVFAQKRTEEILQSGRDRSWQKFNDFCNKLIKFQTTKRGTVKDLLFADITPAYLTKFEIYLHTLHNARHPEKLIHPNTIAEALRQFRTLVNHAIKIGLMPKDKDPFLAFKIKKVKTEKERLNADEVEKIINLELEEGSLIWNVRNYWMFSFYCAGIRVSDVITMRWTNITSDGRIQYQMSKNHKLIDFKLVPQAISILCFYEQFKNKETDYIFPLLDSDAEYAKATLTQSAIDVMPVELKKKWHKRVEAKTALLNKYLKKIAEMAGIEKSLTNHISRHSFAKVAKQKGLDNALLKDLFAHSSLKITENYMGQFDSADNDAALASIFEEPKDPVDTIMELVMELTPEQKKVLLSKITEINL